MKKIKILIVDDEENIRSVIKEYMTNAGYESIEAEQGEQALELLQKQTFDLLILDVMMPKMDGITLLKKLPPKKRIPTIILSARTEEIDKLIGFEQGIDDYVGKPFSPRELLARVHAILQRTTYQEEAYCYQGLVVNFLAHTITIDGKKINVTPKEFELLRFFIENHNIAISREQLLNKLWGYDYYGDDHTIDTHIKMLRNNLGNYRHLIVTVRGIGYKFEEEQDAVN